MKQQLATQEIELNKKNEEADKLIEIVGIETERVSREKAIADEEELKVNQINREVSTKQKDCEEDLKKAQAGTLRLCLAELVHTIEVREEREAVVDEASLFVH